MEEAIGRLKEGDGCIHSYFRYYLLVHLTECIRSTVKGLKGIYLFGSSLNPDRAVFNPTSDINLILLTNRRYPTNAKRMDVLNDILTTMYKDLLSLDCKDCFRILDYHFVDEGTRRKGEGVSVKLRSIEDPALRIWGGG
jgi:hypothetical protein